MSPHNSLFAVLIPIRQSRSADDTKTYKSSDNSLQILESTFQNSTPDHQLWRSSTNKQQPVAGTMCFGERTTFVCPIGKCIICIGADPESGKCAAGNVLGTCSDPWMVYHLEEKVCTECHVRLNEGTPPPPPTTETWHPQDHHHSDPPIPIYERSETDTAITTGRLTGPMLVARDLNRQLPDGGTTVFQRSGPEIQLVDQIDDIISRRNTDGPEPQRWVDTPNLIGSTEATDNMEEDLPDYSCATPSSRRDPARSLPRS